MPDKQEVTQNFTATGNTQSQINQGTINNPSFTIGADSAGIFLQLAALLKTEAANNDIDLDTKELDAVAEGLQEAVETESVTPEQTDTLVGKFKLFIGKYTDNLIPIAGKAALALLATVVSGSPILGMVVAVLQEAIDGDK